MKLRTESSARRTPRGEVGEKGHLDVLVDRENDVDKPRLRGRLEDVSCQGARVLLDAPLEQGEVVEIHIVCDSPKLNLAVDADVRWVHAHRGGWKTGLQFQHAILEDRLDQLAASGVIDRRKTAREPVAADAAFQWCGRPGHMSCQVLDLSGTGACLTSASPGRIGERLLLKVADVAGRTVQVPAVARWNVAYESGHLIGCEFLVDPGPVELPAPAPSSNWTARCRNCFSNVTLLLICTFIAAGLPIWQSQISAVRDFWSGTVGRIEQHSAARRGLGLRTAQSLRPADETAPNAEATALETGVE